MKNIFKNQIKSEKYWRTVLNSQYAIDVLNTIIKRQNGFVSDRQLSILDRDRKGIKSPYPTKN